MRLRAFIISIGPLNTNQKITDTGIAKPTRPLGSKHTNPTITTPSLHLKRHQNFYMSQCSSSHTDLVRIFLYSSSQPISLSAQILRKTNLH